jgi:hypothetical protein
LAGYLLAQPLVQQLNSNANAISGAAFYFYLTGTTTPATVYSDAALTTPLSNPVVADSAGRLANVYLDPGVVYRLVIKSAVGGSEIRDIDPVNKTQSFSDNVRGGSARVAGDTASVVAKWESSSYPAEDLGGLWPSSTVAYGWVFNKDWTSANAPSDGTSPCATLVAIAHNISSQATALAFQAITGIHDDSLEGAGVNFITYSDGGLTDLKMVGLEIDLQPGAGSTVSDGSACYINAFTEDMAASAMQIEGVFGGTFGTGILMGNLGTNGAGLAATGSAPTMATLVNSGNATYTDAAYSLSNTHRLKLRGTSTAHGFIYMDGSNTLRTVLGSGNFVIRDQTDTNSLIAVASDGTAVIGQNATTGSGYHLMVSANAATEGNGVAQFTGSTQVQAVGIFNATGTAGNAAAAALKARANSVNGRSVNAGGTINASGADYAEYELKASDCGTVAKGQIVGFDADGLVTDKWADAVAFGIKSTDPNLVGGDTWAAEVGPEPARPVFEPADYTGTPFPGDLPPAKVDAERINAAREQLEAAFPQIRAGFIAKMGEEAGAARAATYLANKRLKLDHELTKVGAFDDWVEATAAHEADVAAHEASEAERLAAWTANEWADYLAEKAVWDAALEAARQTVDRIAYCGKVPVNVTGATVGQYLVPQADGAGIGCALVNEASLTFAQYRSAVGRVRAILPDGRALATVKPI